MRAVYSDRVIEITIPDLEFAKVHLKNGQVNILISQKMMDRMCNGLYESMTISKDQKDRMFEVLSKVGIGIEVEEE